jgi:hypothetical protein
VINIGSLGIDGAADAVIRAYETKFRNLPGKID